MECEKNRTLLFAAGGTGGHVYPALAVAREWMRRHAEDCIIFAGRNAGLESRLVPSEGFELCPIRAGGVVEKSPLSRLRGMGALMLGFCDSWILLKRRNPVLVAGFGGYVSFSPVAAAALRGTPTLILEINRTLGAATRVLRRFSDAVAVAFEETAREAGAKAVLTGTPIRSFAHYDKEHNKFGILIFGGSQGAKQVNEAMLKALPRLAPYKDRLKLFHMVGLKKNEDSLRQAYEKLGFLAEVTDYYMDIGRAYAQADLVVCRAGALSLAEITALGKASIVIPFPHSAGSHQQDNALALERAGATVLLDSTSDPRFHRGEAETGENLAGAIISLLEDPQRLARMQEASRAAGRSDAATRVADLMEDLLKPSNKAKERFGHVS